MGRTEKSDSFFQRAEPQQLAAAGSTRTSLALNDRLCITGFCRTFHIAIYPGIFWGAVRKIAKRDYQFRYVRPSAWNNSAPTGRIYMKFYIWVWFEELWRTFKFHYTPTRITGTLHEYQCIFLIISRWILLRMRNVSDKSCRENQNTHFLFNNVFRESCCLWDTVEK